MASYFSPQYLMLLLPATAGLYAITPQRVRRVVLLLASYVFFWAVSGSLIVYLLFSTLSIHHLGLWLELTGLTGKQKLAQAEPEQRKSIRASIQQKQRSIILLGVVIHIGLLLTLKYSQFFLGNGNTLLRILHMPAILPVPHFVLPIGISFYTLQAVSYLLDVYRGKIQADRNLFRLALFLGFFPQMMEGPICRYEQTAQRLWDAPKMQWHNFYLGGQRILWGIIKKMVVADRLNIFILNVFSGYDQYDGSVIALAAICYTVQLYMDFSGTIDVALGSAQLFGVAMPENFQRPFFSRTISEFWQRWHITLGTWFKDYIFYPVSMSKHMKKLTSKARKRFGHRYGPILTSSVALLCVWLCNGLWHGSAWNYIFFGLYHFALIFSGNLIQPLVLTVTERLHIDRNHVAYRVMQALRTCVLVCIGELFFRAEGLRNGLKMAWRMVTNWSFTPIVSGNFFAYGMDAADFILVVAFLVFLLFVGLAQERGVRLGERIVAKPWPVRIAVYYAAICFLVIFGAYGIGYIPVDPIYAGF